MTTTRREFSIALTGRLRHGELWKLARRFGSAAALAREVGMSYQELGRWMNMKSAPSESNERQFTAAMKLCCLANKSFEEMWPDEVRDREWLKTDKRIEKTTMVETERLLEWRHRNAALPSPEQIAEELELRESIDAVLETLSEREQLIIKMRFGLGEYRGSPHTLDEVGAAIRLSSGRVQQIEATAKRKLQNPLRSRDLIGFIP